MARHGLVTTETAEFYLVNLLKSLLRPPRPVVGRPLGIQYLEALQSPPASRCQSLRHVGDTALIVSGLFPESLERSLVGPDYYKSLGTLAYRHLSCIASPSSRGLVDVFGELAERFLPVSAVLAAIALDNIFRGHTDLLRLYQRWYYSRRPDDAARLIERGLIPVPPCDHTRH
jgi:hypothetical protein